MEAGVQSDRRDRTPFDTEKFRRKNHFLRRAAEGNRGLKNESIAILGCGNLLFEPLVEKIVGDFPNIGRKIVTSGSQNRAETIVCIEERVELVEIGHRFCDRSPIGKNVVLLRAIVEKWTGRGEGGDFVKIERSPVVFHILAESGKVSVPVANSPMLRIGTSGEWVEAATGDGDGDSWVDRREEIGVVTAERVTDCSDPIGIDVGE